MSAPSKPQSNTIKSPVNPAAEPSGMAGQVPAPSSEPASGATDFIKINVALREFVRALARTAAARDWARAVADLTTETDKSIDEDSNEK